MNVRKLNSLITRVIVGVVLGALLTATPSVAQADIRKTPLAAIDEATAAAFTLSSETGMSSGAAIKVINDQDIANTLITKLRNSTDRQQLTETAPFDVWFKDNEVNLRTKNLEIQRLFENLSMSNATSLNVIDSPAIVDAMNHLVSQSVVESVLIVAPDLQGTYVDTDSGEFVFQMLEQPGGAATETIRSIVPTSAYRIEVMPEPLGDTATFRGGTASSTCTAAFTATYGSYIGVVTAGHCGAQTLSTATNYAAGSKSSGTIRTTAYNQNSDIEFLSLASGHAIAGQFYGSSSSTASNVQSQQDIGEGTRACTRGKTSGYRCGTVTSIAYRPTWSGACPGGTCNAVFVAVNVGTQGGDSGGPWWVSAGNPVGIHKGGSSSMSVYSKIYRIPSGVSLKFP